MSWARSFSLSKQWCSHHWVIALDQVISKSFLDWKFKEKVYAYARNNNNFWNILYHFVLPPTHLKWIFQIWGERRDPYPQFFIPQCSCPYSQCSLCGWTNGRLVKLKDTCMLSKWQLFAEVRLTHLLNYGCNK